MIFTIISLSLCLITALSCLYKKINVSGIYLGCLFLADIVRLILTFVLANSAIPFIGWSLFLFQVHNIIYLAVPALLAYLISESFLKGKCGALPGLCFGSASLLCILGYPNLVRGAALLNLFSSYYLLMFLIGLIIFVLNIKHKLEIDSMILGLASFAGLTWTIFSLIFGFDLAIFGNAFYYGLVLLLIWVKPIKNCLDRIRFQLDSR